MNETLQVQAEAIAARIPQDPAGLGFDPLTLISILMQVLPLLMSCFQRSNAAVNADNVQQQFAEFYRSQPKPCLRKTARRVRGEADHPMTKEQSFEIAQAICDQACSITPAEAAAVFVHAA